MWLELVFGPVGSGKSTLLSACDPDEWVRYTPGGILRAAVGNRPFTAGDRPNAPPVMDAFVWSNFVEHYRLAEALGRPMVAEYPRNADQAQRLVDWLASTMTPGRLTVCAHQLYIRREVWEARMSAVGGRWEGRPDLEAMDRARFDASVRDTMQSGAALETMGKPWVCIRKWTDEQTPKPEHPNLRAYADRVIAQRTPYPPIPKEADRA